MTALSKRNVLADVKISGFPIQVRYLCTGVSAVALASIPSRRRIRSKPATAARKHEYSARPACESSLMSVTPSLY